MINNEDGLGSRWGTQQGCRWKPPLTGIQGEERLRCSTKSGPMLLGMDPQKKSPNSKSSRRWHPGAEPAQGAGQGSQPNPVAAHLGMGVPGLLGVSYGEPGGKSPLAWDARLEPTAVANTAGRGEDRAPWRSDWPETLGANSKRDVKGIEKCRRRPHQPESACPGGMRQPSNYMGPQDGGSVAHMRRRHYCEAWRKTQLRADARLGAGLGSHRATISLGKYWWHGEDDVPQGHFVSLPGIAEQPGRGLAAALAANWRGFKPSPLAQSTRLDFCHSMKRGCLDSKRIDWGQLV